MTQIFSPFHDIITEFLCIKNSVLFLLQSHWQLSCSEFLCTKCHQPGVFTG